ncbi:MAG: sugar phosphate isomerase/epimerase [Terriglobia bacterium]|jgi:sugar phosphate isomerase/epimerase
MQRREFISALGLGSYSLIAGASSSLAAAPVQPAYPGGERTKRQVKIGSVSWNFHSLAPGAHPEEAIDIIGSLGFESIELIANSRKDIDEYWTDSTIDRLKKQMERNRLVVNQYPFFQPVVEGLTSRNPEERKVSLDYFEKGCRIAKKLGAPMVNIVAPWARELKSTATYLPRYFMDDAKPGEKFHIDIAPGYDFDELWHIFVGAIRDCLARAKAHGAKFSIENHTHTMLPVTDSFLRLWDAVHDPMLGFNLDCGWAMNQREYPPVAIHKANKHLLNLHLRDVDARMREYVAIGAGVMDFRAIAEAVKAIGFEGSLSLEQDGSSEDMKETCRRYVSIMKECFA